MRAATVTTLILTAVVTSLFFRRTDCERPEEFVPPDDDEEDIRSRQLFREYGLVRTRLARGEEMFDDYGHLRFGRSDE